MTADKRKEMRKLKEKAILIEKRLIKHKQQEHDGKSNQCNKDTEANDYFPKCFGSICHQSQSDDECGLKNSAESIDLLNKLLEGQLEGNKSNELTKSISKLQKLQKSETTICDYSTNVVIKIPKENANTSADSTKPYSIHNSLSKAPTHLLLAGTNVEGIAATPSICLNPPTPLTASKSFCDTLSDGESSESALTSEHQNKSFDFSHDELSSDNISNSIVTHPDHKYYRYARRNNNSNGKPITFKKTDCAKAQQFDAINNDTNPSQTRIEKVYKNRKLCPKTPSGTMNRSATSPSMKTNTNNRSSSPKSQSLAQDSDNLPESNLVRSSSFTLEAPSKALIEHMQQQELLNVAKYDIKSHPNTIRNSPVNLVSTAIRAHRDTVESRAKKVQKMEIRAPKPKTKLKMAASKLSTAAASTSAYNKKGPTQHINSVCRTKRSPPPTSPQKLQKPIYSKMCKSNSTSSCSNQNKISKSRLSSLSSTATSCNSIGTTDMVNTSLNQTEMNKKVHLLQLLAQQEEEHRNLQEAFELQQKILIEQLGRELAATRLKSSNNSHDSPSKTTTSLPTQRDEQLTSTSTQFIHDHALPNPTASSELSRHNSKAQHPSPHSISINSSYIAFDNNSTQHQNSHKSPSYDSSFTHTMLPNPIYNSQFSTTDHTNNNDSFEIPTLSMHTSTDTPHIQNNTAKNTIFNKTTPSFCRRLFATEMNGTTVEESAVVSTPLAKTHDPTETRNQLLQLNCEGNNDVSFHFCKTVVSFAYFQYLASD